MPDREKVIEGLKCCGTEPASDCHGGCPYDGDGRCIAFLCQEALALLKEQDERIKRYETGEIIRCKDCKYSEPACGNINCKKDGLFAVDIHPVNWFCADGEREEGR